VGRDAEKDHAPLKILVRDFHCDPDFIPF